MLICHSEIPKLTQPLNSRKSGIMRGYTTRHREMPPSCLCEVSHVAELYNLIIPRRKIMAEKMISEQNKSSFYIGNRQKFM